MDGLALLAEAHATGLTVRADGGMLVVRGPRRCAALARSLLEHKPDVMALLAFPIHKPQRIALSPVPLTEIYPVQAGDEWLADSWYALRRRVKEATP